MIADQPDPSATVRPPTKAPAAPTGRRGRRLVLAAAGLLVGLGALYGLGYVYTGSALPAGTTIGGVDVGGVGAADAQLLLEDGLAAAASAPVTLSGHSCRNLGSVRSRAR